MGKSNIFKNLICNFIGRTNYFLDLQRNLFEKRKKLVEKRKNY